MGVQAPLLSLMAPHQIANTHTPKCSDLIGGANLNSPGICDSDHSAGGSRYTQRPMAFAEVLSLAEPASPSSCGCYGDGCAKQKMPFPQTEHNFWIQYMERNTHTCSKFFESCEVDVNARCDGITISSLYPNTEMGTVRSHPTGRSCRCRAHGP